MEADNGDRKTAIARAAAELWAAQGYHGTGVEELSQATGIGRGTLYHHIGSKQQLLCHISRMAIVRLLDSTVQDHNGSCVDRLRRLSRDLMVDLTGHIHEWTVFFREIEWLDGKGRDEVFALRDEYEDIWQRTLEEGAANGEFRAVDPILVKGILGMHNYGYLWMRRSGRLAPEEVADVFVDALLDGLRAEPARRLGPRHR